MAGLLACVLMSCGLFSLRDPESPDLGGVGEDPLNLSGMLEGTEEQFGELEFQDIFPLGFVYEQDGGRPRGKDEFVDRLETVVSKYVDIEVAWRRTKDVSFSRTDTVAIEDMTYEVYLNGATGVSADFTGTVDIYIYFDNTWRIVYWKDFPDNPKDGQYSFFSPDFIE
jgi:hypothetical protein